MQIVLQSAIRPNWFIYYTNFCYMTLDGVKGDVQKPERLELFESELREVLGGATISGSRLGGTRYYSTTFSYSAGWLDVEQPDDCA
jgi:hypothetical protein